MLLTILHSSPAHLVKRAATVVGVERTRASGENQILISSTHNKLRSSVPASALRSPPTRCSPVHKVALNEECRLFSIQMGNTCWQRYRI